METIIYKKIERTEKEIRVEIDEEHCFFRAKYNSYNSPVAAHIGRVLINGRYHTIQWYAEHGKLQLSADVQKRQYINKLPFQKFINDFKEWEKISEKDFFNAWGKVKSEYLSL